MPSTLYVRWLINRHLAPRHPEKTVAFYFRGRVNLCVCDTFIIKLNIGQLNAYSVPVRIKYESHFVADMKVKMRREPELEKTLE